MTQLPKAPAFGAAVPQDASPETLAWLALRRSAPAQTLQAPGPDPEQVQSLLRLATRVPDHGKLAPWRLMIFEGAAKTAYADRIEALADQQPDPVRAKAALIKIRPAPLMIAVIFSPKGPKVPQWEQELSAGAVCQTLLIAAGAMGFGANWLTDWPAYAEDATALLDLTPGERVAGFIYIGTAASAPLERERPDVQNLVSYYAG